MNKSKRLPAIPAGSRFVLFIWRDAAAIRMLLFAGHRGFAERGVSAGCADSFSGGAALRLQGSRGISWRQVCPP